MLDDQNYIADKDSENALAVAMGQPEQLEHDFGYQPLAGPEIKNVVVAGMGGSALAGLLCRDWWSDRLRVPFEVVRDYELPAYVDEHTLVVVSSYSGNTEETVAALDDALGEKARIVVLASGGKLQQAATEHDDLAFVKLPSGYEPVPRMTVWYGVRALAEIFEAHQLLTGALDELSRTVGPLKAAAAQYAPELLTAENRAKQLAQEAMGKVMFAYGSPLLVGAAYKWKISWHENAKNVAAYGMLPEFNHNEFLGWNSHPVEKPFFVVELQSTFDHERVAKRFELSNRLLSGKMPAPVEVVAEGQNRIEQILWTVLLGDFTSIYLAILNGVNPTEVNLIERLKKELE